MTLIKSISGIRGTIGGAEGQALTPIDIVKFTAAFGTFCKKHSDSRKIVIGRDARISGPMVSGIVASTLQGIGFDVVDLGLSTTPTVEIAVPIEYASGGIIITASHNPMQWNALKLLNHKGEFISAEDGLEILQIAESGQLSFADVKLLGEYTVNESYIDKHIEMILALPLVDVQAIRARDYSVAIDCVNSTGGIAVPRLLRALGVEKITELNCEAHGHFAHNPEPLPENLTQISGMMEKGKFDLGIVVDPDVDRLALLQEDGTAFGEEYTLVAVADYVLRSSPGNTVSNLSSTRALRDITLKKGGSYNAAAVGEVNVVQKMKETNAIIGGEGNGGIIYPKLHYGRDALVGIALFLSQLAKTGKSISFLRQQYPNYYISKNKIELTPDVDVDAILAAIENKYKNNQINTIDGVKIDFENEWIHLRKSNTEPIIRIYAESETMATAEHLANKIISDIRELISGNNE
ncbi:MAG: phosphoglucosamine mutase [Cyclobacteriaceae bacterium]|nr:phosphoglucosamine mutase [Cyclobacteriaceae bacterium]